MGVLHREGTGLDTHAWMETKRKRPCKQAWRTTAGPIGSGTLPGIKAVSAALATHTTTTFIPLTHPPANSAIVDMGKLNLPTVVQKGPSGTRKPANRNTNGGTQPVDDTKAIYTSLANIDQPTKVLLPSVQSDYTRMAPARRATVSFNVPTNRGHPHTLETTQIRDRPPSSPPPARASTTLSFSQSSSRLASPPPRGRDQQHAIQDRYPSILECLYRHKGDAQASPSLRQDTTDVSPIDAAARHAQERGCSARAEALQVVGTLLKRVYQQKIDKEEVRNVFFMTCTDTFARDPLDNVAEVSFAFQLLCVLVQEEIMQGDVFIKAAAMLGEEGHHDGCKLLVKLVLDDNRLKLATDEVDTLTDIVSNLKSGRDKRKARV